MCSATRYRRRAVRGRTNASSLTSAYNTHPRISGEALMHEGTELLVLSGADIRALVSTAECIELVDQAMRTVSSGGAILPLRSWVKLPGTANLVGWMPGFLDSPPRVGVKLIGIFPE